MSQRPRVALEPMSAGFYGGLHGHYMLATREGRGATSPRRRSCGARAMSLWRESRRRCRYLNWAGEARDSAATLAGSRAAHALSTTCPSLDVSERPDTRPSTKAGCFASTKAWYAALTLVHTAT